ncbi:hypothetical protein FACS1894186_7460 [Alphaproteobacteria bacterium]|nr:hypothetical protein FACS1894186_7460 [Alphaproteobacteria bacterium]
MKILIDPAWKDLVEDLSDSDKATILMCILDYPSYDCQLGIWRFMRKSIDRDSKVYKEKCAKIANARLHNPDNNPNIRADNKPDSSPDISPDSSRKGKGKGKGNMPFSKRKGKEKVFPAVEEADAPGGAGPAGAPGGATAPLPGIIPPLLAGQYMVMDFGLEQLHERIPRLASWLADNYPRAVLDKTLQALERKKYGKMVKLSTIKSWLDSDLEMLKNEGRA